MPANSSRLLFAQKTNTHHSPEGCNHAGWRERIAEKVASFAYGYHG